MPGNLNTIRSVNTDQTNASNSPISIAVSTTRSLIERGRNWFANSSHLHSGVNRIFDGFRSRRSRNVDHDLEDAEVNQQNSNSSASSLERTISRTDGIIAINNEAINEIRRLQASSEPSNFYSIQELQQLKEDLRERNHEINDVQKQKIGNYEKRINNINQIDDNNGIFGNNNHNDDDQINDDKNGHAVNDNDQIDDDTNGNVEVVDNDIRSNHDDTNGDVEVVDNDIRSNHDDSNGDIEVVDNNNAIKREKISKEMSKAKEVFFEKIKTIDSFVFPYKDKKLGTFRKFASLPRISKRKKEQICSDAANKSLKDVDLASLKLDYTAVKSCLEEIIQKYSKDGEMPSKD
ncbi:hypothetical protein BN7_5248 [Wickerhamomyces ciferrii]|uniref:Uncharacterized protein n=1 Tax=Wickerhamomyces ciferrii (strain ATCC 14091 / BCRC 22168 / CBS 111 / JCM 3599 / NBRC 0793 / NRRL Y-1031 F-60-10) TaxID=1206466 RepID=K0KX47_WICCF|nr:uncharacterized protein BN7_5248 [Wickerhamomyces ciferrii]CCH45663.1 hypothetical protein BN7_5248 [Wickerhamomyces ciferrii]